MAKKSEFKLIEDEEPDIAEPELKPISDALSEEVLDSNSPEAIAAAAAAAAAVGQQAELDADELEYKNLRRDLPGITGAAAQGIVSISVAKKPPENTFFRTHTLFRPKVPLVHVEVGMEPQYFAVAPSMEIPLHGMGINYTDHLLYLTISPEGSFRVIPVNCETDNEYTKTKEVGLLDGEKRWVRLYTDRPNKRYRVYPAPVERYDEPTWPQLSEAKIFRLCFRDKGRLVDSPEHELVRKWAGRDR